MSDYSNNRIEQIDKIAFCLANKFVKPLYNLCDEKNYQGYISCLTEILKWASEFYNKYYYELYNWRVFEKSMKNIYNAGDRDDFLIAWGCSRIRRFYIQHINKKEYCLKRSNINKNKRVQTRMRIAS